MAPLLALQPLQLPTSARGAQRLPGREDSRRSETHRGGHPSAASHQGD